VMALTTPCVATTPSMDAGFKRAFHTRHVEGLLSSFGLRILDGWVQRSEALIGCKGRVLLGSGYVFQPYEHSHSL
jgi:hypothetical protein